MAVDGDGVWGGSKAMLSLTYDARNQLRSSSGIERQRSRAAKRSMSEFGPETMMRSWLVTTVLASA
jgi:hypothetical protein